MKSTFSFIVTSAKKKLNPMISHKKIKKWSDIYPKMSKYFTSLIIITKKEIVLHLDFLQLLTINRLIKIEKVSKSTHDKEIRKIVKTKHFTSN